MEKIDLTVAGCILFRKKILLLHHVKYNKWLLPGGHIRENETPDTALIREIHEETNLHFKFLQFGFIKSTSKTKRLAIPFHTNIHKANDHLHYCLYYLGTVKNENFKMDRESDIMDWFSNKKILVTRNIPEHIKKICKYSLKTFNNIIWKK
jgi:8-oxo-dGTP diphosphatase